MKRLLHQTVESYKKTLLELHRRVSAGVKLEYYDCTDWGAKNTECTLGLCADDIQDMQDGTYSDKFQPCPNDSRQFDEHGNKKVGEKDTSSGCFYHCHIFKGDERTRKLTGKRILKVVKDNL